MNDQKDKELSFPSPSSAPFFSSTEERLGSESLLSVVENYIQYYASGETHTARAKRYDLQYFIEFLAGSPASVNRVMVSEWTLQRTKDFVDDRLSRGEAPATVARRLATIKHFGRTLAERFAGYINPAREVKGPVLNLTRPSGLSEEEIALLRQATTALEGERKNTFLNVRDRFLLELLLVTGLRADEVRLLVISQLSEDLQWLKNVKTKGKRYRNVYVSSELRPLFQRYLDIRISSLMERFPLLQSAPPSHLLRFPVLVSFYNADPADAATFGLSPKTVFNIVSRLGKRAETLSGEHLHPHKLRHTFAHGLLDSSRDIRLVAQALGHSDVRTTMRYTERSEQEIALAIEKQRG